MYRFSDTYPSQTRSGYVYTELNFQPYLALTPSSTPTSALCEEDVNYVITELGLPNTRRCHRQICDMLGGGGGQPAVKKARRDSLQARDPSVFSAEYSDTESYDDTALPPPSSPPQTIAATAERTRVRAAYTRQSLQLSASEARWKPSLSTSRQITTTWTR